MRKSAGRARNTGINVTTKKPLSKAKPAAKLSKPAAKPLKSKVPQRAASPVKKPKPAPAKVEVKKHDLTKGLGKAVKLEPKAPMKPAMKVIGKEPIKAAAKKFQEKKLAERAGAAKPLDRKAKPGAKLDPKAVLAKKNGAEPGQPGQPAKDDPDAPLLDMSDAAVRKMNTRAKQRGYVTYDELNRVLPSDKVSSEQIEDTMSMLNEMGINVIESEEQEETDGEQVPAVGAPRQIVEQPEKAEETYDRTDDPVRMYLREMGSVELLSREGEIDIAKRIEAGRELMIGALCEGPLTFEALTVWRDELMEGKALLRDIIDLEAMYGGMPGAEGVPGQPGVPGAMPGMPGGPPAPGPNGAPPVGAPPKAFTPPPPPPPPAPPPPQVKPAAVKAPGETAEGGEGETGEGGARPIAGDEDFDDESNLSLSAMEAALNPQELETLDQIAALYKRQGK